MELTERMRLLSWDRLHTILLANGYPDVIRKQPEFVNIGVPQQPKMSHACGIFTILYVSCSESHYATTLGRAKRTWNEDFLSSVLRIILSMRDILDCEVHWEGEVASNDAKMADGV